MSKNRNPYAMAHSLRGGAGAGAHRDRRRDIEDDFTDPYSPEWMDACPRGSDAPIIDNDVKDPDLIPSGSGFKPLSREFLLARGYCCDTGCTNCPYK